MPRYFRFSLLLPALLWSAPAIAGNAPIGGAGSCSGQTITDPVASTQGQQQAFDDGLYTCTGSVWAAEAFIVGGVDQSNSAPSCNSTNAGMVKYSSSTFYGCNGSSWVPMDSGYHFISTQTASNSASLQWTSLGSYNTYQIRCTDILPATNATYILLQFGEGGTPTWETANSSYGYSGYWENASGTSTLESSTGDSITNGIMVEAQVSNSVSATKNGSEAIIDIANPAGAGAKQAVVHSGGYQVSGGVNLNYIGGGAYIADTNAITAIRLIAGSGNITSGTCSLYGMN
jgi:hypothetical protein